MQRVIPLLAALLSFVPVLPAMGGQERPALDELRVVGEREIDLDDSQPISLSPDGRFVAVWRSGDDANAICAYDAMTLAEHRCASVTARSIDPNGAAWSPDGTHLAFTEDAVLRLDESDLWVFDVAAGTATNLTDDEADASLISEPAGMNADLAPAWSSDGSELVFARTESAATALYRIPAEGGTAERVLTIDPEQRFAVYASLHWLPNDLLLYSVAAPNEDAGNGIWAVPVAGGEPRRLIEPDPEAGTPLLMAIAPGGVGLLYYPFARVAQYELPPPAFALAHLASGRVDAIEAASEEPVPPRATAAAFSPDGERLLVSYTAAGTGGLAVRDLASGDEEVIAERDLALQPHLSGRGVSWAANVLVFSLGPGRTAVLLRLGTGGGTPVPESTSQPGGTEEAMRTPSATPTSTDPTATVTAPTEAPTVESGSGRPDIAGNTYVSPNYGYSLHWDDAWRSVEVSSTGERTPCGSRTARAASTSRATPSPGRRRTASPRPASSMRTTRPTATLPC